MCALQIHVHLVSIEEMIKDKHQEVCYWLQHFEFVICDLVCPVSLCP